MQSGSSGAELIAGAPLDGVDGVMPASRSWGRWAVLIWGGSAYALFLVSLTRFIVFLSGLGSRGIDAGSTVAVWPALVERRSRRGALGEVRRAPASRPSTRDRHSL